MMNMFQQIGRHAPIWVAGHLIGLDTIVPIVGSLMCPLGYHSRAWHTISMGQEEAQR